MSDATWTLRRSVKPDKEAPIEIPQECWVGSIGELNPIRVYNHRFNLVMVLSSSETSENGLYIGALQSSYSPRDGDANSGFGQIEGGVYAFERKKQADMSLYLMREAACIFAGELFDLPQEQQKVIECSSGPGMLCKDSLIQQVEVLPRLAVPAGWLRRRWRKTFWESRIRGGVPALRSPESKSCSDPGRCLCEPPC